MKLLYQFGVILGITFAGEIIHALLPFPIPASIYGLVLMLLCLCTKIVKLQQVKIAADFLIDIMPPMFIPAAVGMCGEAAADPLLIPVLISFGLGEFSVSAPSILRTRRIISEWTKADADALTEKVMKLKTATEVKAMLQAAAR